jgi:hypothetical protein
MPQAVSVSRSPLHTALLEEYDLLLTVLRDLPNVASAPANTFVKPRPASPMALDLEEGQKSPRADGLVSVASMAMYYGMTPWDCENSVEHQRAIETLEEKRATLSLNIDEGVDIDFLSRPPTAKDRKLLRTINRLKPEAGMTLEHLLIQLTKTEMVEIVRKAIPDNVSSLIAHLLSTCGEEITPAQISARPAVYLEKILRSAEAERITDALLTGLNWFGAAPGEETSSAVRAKLLGRAIRLWSGPADKFDSPDIAGYAWHSPSNFGKSYSSIWSEFEQHLLDTKKASSTQEAILLARLFRGKFPSDFRRPDVPAELSYRSSVVWVNFMHGLNFAELMEPERAQYMGFQQILVYALEKSVDASELQAEISTWCRIAPAVDWAVARGLLRDQPGTPFTADEQQRALKAVDRHIEAMKNAIKTMEIAPPTRVDIADKELLRVFGPATFGHQRMQLIRDYGSDAGGRLKDGPVLKGTPYPFRDVYMAGLLEQGPWYLATPDGKRKTAARLQVKSDGQVSISGPGMPDIVKKEKLKKSDTLFKSAFDAYMTKEKAAYRTLLEDLFCSIPHDDLQAMEYGETRIYTLRDATKDLEMQMETAELTDPLRLRMGFLLQLKIADRCSWYECLPRVGIIRRRTDVSESMLNGRKETANYRAKHNVKVEVLRGIEVPFDRDAFDIGALPAKGATCKSIIELLGKPFTPEPQNGLPLPIATERASEIAAFIAKKFYFYDEEHVYDAAYAITDFEKKEQSRQELGIVKYLVPFIGSIEDLKSKDPNIRIMGMFGLYIDVLTFGMPFGRFLGGVAKVARLSIGFRAALPLYAGLSRKLLVSSMKNLVLLLELPALTRLGVRALYFGIRYLLNKAINGLSHLAGRVGHYNVLKGLPQVANVGSYRRLGAADDLATFDGIDDVLVRKTAKTSLADHRLVDPANGKAYGPRLQSMPAQFTLGRSEYRTLNNVDQHITVELADNASVRELFEVDGRTTMLINDVPYQLDAEQLRRVDKIDTGKRFKALPCRIKRSPGADCETRYVTGTPAELPLTPYDESRGWATWFGDTIYTPAAGRSPIKVRSLANHHKLEGTTVLRKGIFARVKIKVPENNLDDTFEVGAIVCESMDGARQYVFTRLSAGDFYVAELATGQSIQTALTFKKASTLPQDLQDELLTVYIGSLNANNIARIYGITAVERALRTMDEIAIPIGGHANPPGTLKLLKVDTSPGEAVLFDHSTRMIVSHGPAGSATWSRSRHASEPFRQRTADIFDTLFVKQQTVPVRPDSNLKINKTMTELQEMLPDGYKTGNARNIAYADVVTATGQREVYVSVSGGVGLTSELPLFKSPFAKDKVIVGDTTYFNVDAGKTFNRTSLNVSEDGKLLAIPHTIKNIDTYTPAITSRPTSLDSEAKLIGVIRGKYPDIKTIRSINVVTTMPPCSSCSVVIKEFGYDGAADGLKVLWG